MSSTMFRHFHLIWKTNMAIIGNSWIRIAENSNILSETTRSNDVILLASSLANCYDPPVFYSPFAAIGGDWRRLVVRRVLVFPRCNQRKLVPIRMRVKKHVFGRKNVSIKWMHIRKV